MIDGQGGPLIHQMALRPWGKGYGNRDMGNMAILFFLQDRIFPFEMEFSTTPLFNTQEVRSNTLPKNSFAQSREHQFQSILYMGIPKYQVLLLSVTFFALHYIFIATNDQNSNTFS